MLTNKDARPELFRAPDRDAHPVATLARSGHSPKGTLAEGDTRRRGHSPNGDATPSSRRNARPQRGRRGPTHVHSSVCHSERSEESTWSSAACSRGKAHAGFFASLRMTAAVQLPRSLLLCFRVAVITHDSIRTFSRPCAHRRATMSGPSLNRVRTFVQPCSHMGSTLSAPPLEAVRTLSRRCSHLCATVCRPWLDRVRTRARRGADGGTSLAPTKKPRPKLARGFFVTVEILKASRRWPASRRRRRSG